MVAGKKILVEGESDKRVIQAMGGLSLNEEEIRVAGRFSVLCEDIESEVKSPRRIEHLAIVFDANGSPDGQWKLVRERILDAYSELPATPPQRKKLEDRIPAAPTNKQSEGIWVDDFKPWITGYQTSLGLWMMPSNYEKGALEDFLVRIVDPDNPYWRPALNYVNEVSNIHRGFPTYKIFSESKSTKARIHAWLAIQESSGDPPGKAMARAIKAGSLDIQSKEAQNFKRWLEKLK